MTQKTFREINTSVSSLVKTLISRENVDFFVKIGIFRENTNTVIFVDFFFLESQMIGSSNKSTSNQIRSLQHQS